MFCFVMPCLLSPQRGGQDANAGRAQDIGQRPGIVASSELAGFWIEYKIDLW